MTEPPPIQARRRILKPVRIVRLHDRLFASVAIGIVVFLLLEASDLRLPTRLLITWNLAVAVYLVRAYLIMRAFDVTRVRQRAAMQDEGGRLILVLTVLASIASLAAIFAELGPAKDGTGHSAASLSLAMVTIVLSWAFIHVIFAFHYVHEYYGEGRDKRSGGLIFPDDDQPDYLDFVYFSFVVGMTFQVSDVQVTSKVLRHIVVAHGAVAFLFNVSILAVAVNLASNII